MNFAEAFGANFAENKNAIRIRTFDLNGHTFKVKVPLTSEMEAMQERLKVVNDELVAKYYAQLTSGLDEHMDTIKETDGIEIKDDDVIIDGRSLRDIAKNKALAECRVVEMFKLLVPEQKEFDMNTITYEMIEELFPFSIQLEVMEQIGKTISPEYKETRGK